jgi:hypothetical protein
VATIHQIVEATKKLQSAIDAFIEETGWNDAGVLTSWVMVGHQARWEGEDLIDTYPIWFKDAQQSRHITAGLLSTALDQIDDPDGYRRLDDEDD